MDTGSVSLVSSVVGGLVMLMLDIVVIALALAFVIMRARMRIPLALLFLPALAVVVFLAGQGRFDLATVALASAALLLDIVLVALIASLLPTGRKPC